MKNIYVKPQMTKTEVATENAILVGSVFNQEGDHIQLIKQQNALPADIDVRGNGKAVRVNGYQLL